MKAPGQAGTGRSPGEAAAAISSAAVHRSKTARWPIVVTGCPSLLLRIDRLPEPRLRGCPPALQHWRSAVLLLSFVGALHAALARARGSKCEANVQHRCQGSSMEWRTRKSVRQNRPWEMTVNEELDQRAMCTHSLPRGAARLYKQQL